jgi:DNA-binding MarR family transcriptional regulator
MSDPLHHERLTYYVKVAELTQRVATAPLLMAFDLSYAQFSMLLTVSRLPGSSSAALSRMHGITAQSGGEIISALLRRGLVNRETAPTGRALHISLTTVGRRLVDDAQAGLDAIDHRLSEGLSEPEIEIARKVLKTIIANGDTTPPWLTALHHHM